MRKLTIVLLSLFLVTPSLAITITVDDDAPADFNNIQAAIDDANDGDIIEVQPGLYEGDINFLGKNIKVTSTNPLDVEVLSSTIIGGVWPNESIITFRGTEDPNCTLSGFRIRGCIIGNGWPEAQNTRATISHCQFQNNGGIVGTVISNCDGLIINCLIAENRNRGVLTVLSAGPIVECYGIIKNCTIVDNEGNGIDLNTEYPQFKLTAADGEGGDEFGHSVAIDGDYTIVGAFRDHDNGSDSGSAYIFHKSGTTWVQQAKITASDGARYDFFGYSVSIDGDYAILGAPKDDDNERDSGSAYIFHKSGTTWVQQAKLITSDGAYFDYFGHSVSIDGNYAIIGAFGDRYGSGSAYIFHRSGTTWVQQAKLTASDGLNGDWFGLSVSIDGDYTIIGAVYDDDRGGDSGSAYIFHRSGTSWTQQAKLIASDAAGGDEFGYSVAIDSDYAIVGASRNNSAYIFQRNGTSWAQQSKLTASDGAREDYFGRSVSIDGDYTIIGALGDDDNGRNSGSAYIFCRSGTNWVQQDKLTASDGAYKAYFGSSVSIDGNYAITGAYGDGDYSGHNIGSAYIFGPLYDLGVVEISNCIMWDNTSDQIFYENFDVLVNHSNIQGGWPGDGNIDTDPCFVSPGYWDTNGTPTNSNDDFWVEGDYRLKLDSPCIDAGDPNFIPEPNETDLDGNPRVANGRVDMGAYELSNHIPIADAGQDKTVYAGKNNIAEVALDGSASYDDDGDELSYLWGWEIAGQLYEANSVNPTIELPLGQYLIELIVNDGTVDSEPNYVTVEVVGPMELLDTLGQYILGLELQKGIENSLLAKLDTALEKLEDDNENNDTAAIKSLEAFINAAGAQRGKKIPETDADALIAAAQQIIELLSDE